MIATTSTETDRLVRRIGIHVRAGRYALAARILDDAAREAGDDPESQPGKGFTAVSLAAAGAPDEAVNALERYGIRSVADVDGRTDAELLALPGIGVGRLAVLRRCCRGW